MEDLELRFLLTSYSHTIPSGHTEVWLKPGTLDGQVQVRLDSPTGTLDYTFTNQNGMDIISAGTQSGVTFHDAVPVALKPTNDLDSDNGIKVQGGSGGTLEVDAGADDVLIQLTASTSTSGAVTSVDTGALGGVSRYGSGISHLTLRANDAGGATINVGAFGGAALSPAISLRIDTGLGTGDTINLGGNEDDSVVGVTVVTGAGNDVVNLSTDDDTDELVTATVDFIADTSDSGNELHLFGNSTATVEHTTTSTDPIGIELITAQSLIDQATVTIADPAQIGELHLLSDADTGRGTETAIISAPCSITTLACNYGGTAIIEAPCTIGTLAFAGTFAPLQTTPTLVEFTGSAATSTIGSITDSVNQGVVTLDADATVTIQSSSRVGALNIGEDALLTLRARAATSETHARLLTVTSLDLGTDTSGNPLGTLDLKDNDLIIKSGSVGTWNGTAYTGLTGIITHAYASGAWSGTGIKTSMTDAIAPNTLTSIGIASAADVASGGVWAQGGSYNVTVDSTDVLIKYTYDGDANLDGAVTGDDYFQIDGGIAAHIAGWLNGDFNLDGVVNGDDYFIIDSNVPGQGDPL